MWREIEESGGAALAVPTDVADHDRVDAAAEAIERELGPIDLWVNNAMTTAFSSHEEIEPGVCAPGLETVGRLDPARCVSGIPGTVVPRVVPN